MTSPTWIAYRCDWCNEESDDLIPESAGLPDGWTVEGADEHGPFHRCPDCQRDPVCPECWATLPCPCPEGP